MTRKVPSPPRIAPLHRIVAQPITDPAEQAILDKARGREKQNAAGPRPKTNRNGKKRPS
jgi:hypothetical protein